MSEPKPTTESIFWAALAGESPEERARYLDRACGGDVKLRGQIEELLAAYPKVERFLEAPATGLGVTVELILLPERLGTVIGPYKLLQPIGEGGMGAVFLAEQQEPIQRKVALKIIKPGMDSRQVLARFEAERQALALMDHPNIAKVLDAGATPGGPDGGSVGRPYFVMELVKGVPLTSYCDEHHLTPKQRLELFLPVCQAIQHAHQKGIIHRDLKPSNVLVTLYDGVPVPKVIDFGVAKATGSKLTERTLFTEFGQVVGTLEYMSPEQAQLNNLDIDTRSDVYSLGVLLYELLTGTTPLDNKRLKESSLLEVLRIIREEEPPKPSTRLSTTEELPTLAANRATEPKRLTALVRGELDWIVMKCLEKDRNRRYDTAAGLARDIERYLRDEPVLACPPSVWYRLRKFVRRHRGPVLAAAALLGMLLFTLTLALHSNYRVSRALADRTAAYGKLEGEQQNTAAALLRETALKDQETTLKNRSNEALDQERLASAHGDQTVKLWDLRGGKVSLVLRGHTRVVTALAFSPDGQFLASASEDQTVKVWDANAAQGVVLSAASAAAIRAVKFSPAGGWLAVLRRTTVAGPPTSPQGWIAFLDATTGQDIPSLRNVGTKVWGFALSPDGRRVARTEGDKTVRVEDVKTGQEVLVCRGHTETAAAVAFSPDGRRLASGGKDRTIRVWDAETGEELQTLQGHTHDIHDLAFHPDGRHLASAGHDRSLRVWDTITGGQQFLHGGHTMPVLTVAFSPDGRLVASGSADKTVQCLDAATGRELFTLGEHGSAVTGVAFGPDGKRLTAATADGGVVLWDLTTRRKALTLRGDKTSAHGIAFSADGRRLACGGLDGTLRIWDGSAWEEPAATGPEAGPFPPVGQATDSGNSLRNTTKRQEKAAGEQQKPPRPGLGRDGSAAAGPTVPHQEQCKGT